MSLSLQQCGTIRQTATVASTTTATTKATTSTTKKRGSDSNSNNNRNFRASLLFSDYLTEELDTIVVFVEFKNPTLISRSLLGLL